MQQCLIRDGERYPHDYRRRHADVGDANGEHEDEGYEEAPGAVKPNVPLADGIAYQGGSRRRTTRSRSAPDGQGTGPPARMPGGEPPGLRVERGAVGLYERHGFRTIDRAQVVPHERIRYEGDVLLMMVPA